MGYEKNKRPFAFTAGAKLSPSSGDFGVVVSVESLTSTNSGDTINAHGKTYITSGATAGDNIFLLPAPPAVGITKTIVVDVNTTDAVDIVGATTTITFFGSTSNLIRFSTGAVLPKRCILSSRSTSSTGGWAVEYLSTGVTIAGSTVSTG